MATGVVIRGNKIGTDVNSTVNLGNTFAGIEINQAANAVIGGALQGEGNVVSGNHQDGIYLTKAPAATIQGNIVGLDSSGSLALGNNGAGIDVQDTAGVLIGGLQTGEGNVVADNHNIGVAIGGASSIGNVIQGNLIGTDANGHQAFGNFIGVAIQDASNTIVGGTAAGARNVISGNHQEGVFIGGASHDNVILGNLIGTDIAGLVSLGNNGYGVQISSPNNTIGGTTSGAGNVISGQSVYGGVFITDPSAVMNMIQGNKIGTDITGTVALGNFVGLRIAGANTQVGGTDPGAGNLVSGNLNDGLDLSATGTVIQGNRIGTDATGTKAIGNGAAGIYVYPGGGNFQIGGTAVLAPNVIAHNATGGVYLGDSGTILGNSIFDNFNGLTPVGIANQPKGAHNFPVLLSATASAGGTTITGKLNSTPNHTFRIEFFSNTGTDKAGSAEGQTLKGYAIVKTDGNGDATFNYTTGALATGSLVTATATDNTSNGTSIFSASVTSGLPPTITSVGNATFFQGRTNSFTVAATGKGVPALTQTGALPAGVQFHDNGDGTATVTGKPTASGTFALTITAANGNGANAVQTFNLVVLPPAAAFVLALYQDDLGRAGDLSNPNDAGGWVTALTNGKLDQAAVATSIAHSQEARTHVVVGWYQTYLARQPQKGEAQFWVGQLQQGQTEEQVLGNLLASDEFFTRAQTLVGSGTSQERYLQGLYQLLLNRKGSAEEVAGWVNAVPQLGRQGMALGFLGATEYRTDAITGDYNTLLHRAPDPGLQDWVFSNLDLASIRTGFEASAEFFIKG